MSGFLIGIILAAIAFVTVMVFLWIDLGRKVETTGVIHQRPNDWPDDEMDNTSLGQDIRGKTSLDQE